MFYSDDPVRDFDRYDAEQARNARKRPVCECCGDHITDEFAYNFDGDWICQDCIKDFLEEVTDDD